jgi:hypothetical protein
MTRSRPEDLETTFAAADVEGIEERLEDFIRPYLKLLARREQREHAALYIGGRLRQLPRRTVEPIATEHGRKRRPLQHFVGAGAHRRGSRRARRTPEVALDGPMAELGQFN